MELSAPVLGLHVDSEIGPGLQLGEEPVSSDHQLCLNIGVMTSPVCPWHPLSHEELQTQGGCPGKDHSALTVILCY